MDLAALIIAILAFLMASANLIVFLAKNVFSSHVVQMVPAETLVPNKGVSIPEPELTFEEFDAPSAMDLALKDKFRKA